MSQRGDGIGLEVTNTVIRGVRLSADEPGRIAQVAEVPVDRFEDHALVFDALVRVGGQLGATALPTRVGWFPTRATMQRLDVTGLSGPELNSIRHELAGASKITSTMLIDADARRWMLALRWDHTSAWRVQELVERAGFLDVAVEPAPVALERVLAASSTAARRDAAEGRSWVAIYDGSVPIAAVTTDTNDREFPGLTTTEQRIGLHELGETLAADRLAAEVGRIARDLLPNKGRSSELDVHLQLVGEPYPPFPAHDLRAPQRVAVALGAAAGSAGLAGRLRPVDVLTPTGQLSESIPRPWAVHRVTDEALQPAEQSRSRQKWWRRRR